jgi:hypothetical protein
MKKYIISLMIVMTFGFYTNLTAADSWPGESVTGTYQANVYCAPTLTPEDNGSGGQHANIGTFFAGTNIVPLGTLSGNGSQTFYPQFTWHLYGPTNALYTATTDMTGLTHSDGSQLIGIWNVNGEDNPVGFWGVPTLPADFPGSSSVVMDCDQTPKDFVFKATGYIPGPASPTTKYYVVTLTVSATI